MPAAMSQSTYPERDYRFGEQILALRTSSNLTQSRLARLLGISRQAFVGWETGTSYPSPQHLKHLIELCLQHGAFHRGQAAEEIRALWQNARQRVPLDETWLMHLLEKRPEAATAPHSPRVNVKPPKLEPHADWGDAPDVSNFYGREPELAVLTEWLLTRHCRVIGLLGMGGIGKTSLAAKLAQEVAPRFERAYWRSLRDAPPPGEWLAGAIGFLSDQQVVPPAAEAERLAALLGLLRTRRCLLVLDNLETLFEPGQTEGRYRAGLAGYRRLLQAIGEAAHQSCLVLTSREAPPEMGVLGGDAVRIFPLGGLGVNEARQLLASKQLLGTSQQWAELAGRFGGNGLALKLIGERIRELFGGEISLFLEQESISSVFGGIRRLLDEQVERSSVAEQQVLRALAVAREPVRLADLLDALGECLSRKAVLEAMEALLRRSLVERHETDGAANFTLQSVVLEYVTERLVEEVAEEIARGQPALLVEQSLLEVQTPDYVRHSQERLIGVPILERLNSTAGQEGTEQLLLTLLDGWRDRPEAEQGYGPGHVINLLRLLRGDLRGLDLSHLAIRQVYLAEVDAQDTSLAGANLIKTVLADAFSFAVAMALSGNGALLAAGTSTGEVRLWRVADRTLLAMLEGHTGPVFAVALSADGGLVASGGGDGTVRLWDPHTGIGRPLATLEGHTGVVYAVALSPDGGLAASGGGDGTVRLWDPHAERLLVTLEGHASAVHGVALSADGRLLASGGTDGVIRLWDAHAGTGRPLATLEAHTGGVWGVALSADGGLLASGGGDGAVRLWETRTGRVLASLEGHSGMVWSVLLSADGRLLASGGEDGTVRLWDPHAERPLASLQGHIGGVWAVSLSADGRLLASAGLNGTVRLWNAHPSLARQLATLEGRTSAFWCVALTADARMVAGGGADGTVRLWETASGRLLASLQSHEGGVYSVSLSADGHLLASGNTDGTVRLWLLAPGSAGKTNGRLLAILEGHTGGVHSMSLSADGRLLASGSTDGTVRLWETDTGRLLAILEGHTSVVWGIALSADGRLLASGGEDGTVRLWDAQAGTGQPLATLEGHTGIVRSVALSADGRLLASGSTDGTVRLWDAQAGTGQLLAVLQGHTGGVFSVALSADGLLLASGCGDGTVRLWDAQAGSGQPLATLEGHTGVVRSVAVSAEGHLLASGGWDGIVQVWEAPTGAHVRTLQAERCYERLDITGLTGITEAQRNALVALGAVDRRAPGGA